jgi:hypothetical protein
VFDQRKTECRLNRLCYTRNPDISWQQFATRVRALSLECFWLGSVIVCDSPLAFRPEIAYVPVFVEPTLARACTSGMLL